MTARELHLTDVDRDTVLAAYVKQGGIERRALRRLGVERPALSDLEGCA
jgi:hypothetical protein